MLAGVLAISQPCLLCEQQEMKMLDADCSQRLRWLGAVGQNRLPKTGESSPVHLCAHLNTISIKGRKQGHSQQVGKQQDRWLTVCRLKWTSML